MSDRLRGDVRRAARGVCGGGAAVWELETGEVALFKGSAGVCAVTPDGHRVVSGDYDGTLTVWDMETRQVVAALPGHSSQVNDCVVTPDGHFVVSSANDGIRILELETRREVATCPINTRGCEVTPDGKRVVFISTGQPALKVWDLENREVSTLSSEADGTVQAVTPDGRLVVSSSYDGTLKVWDLETGRKVATLRGHVDDVHDCAVTSDGQRLVSASADCTLKVWDLGKMLNVATLLLASASGDVNSGRIERAA